MSRSGYSDDFDGWPSICYRGAVASAIRGARGQLLLRDTLAALDAMPVKELIADSLVEADGSFCTLGVLGRQRGIQIEKLDAENPDMVAAAFKVAPALVREIVFHNDEVGESSCWNDTPETSAARWTRMRAWVASLITEPSKEAP